MVKKNKTIQINLKISPRLLYSILAIFIIVAVGGVVYAYGTNDPATFGHSEGELNLEGLENLNIQDTLIVPTISTGHVWSMGLHTVGNVDASGDINAGGNVYASNIPEGLYINSNNQLCWGEMGTGCAVQSKLCNGEVVKTFTIGGGTTCGDIGQYGSEECDGLCKSHYVPICYGDDPSLSGCGGTPTIAQADFGTFKSCPGESSPVIYCYCKATSVSYQKEVSTAINPTCVP